MFSKVEELQNWLHTRRRSTAQVTYRALSCARAKNSACVNGGTNNTIKRVQTGSNDPIVATGILLLKPN